MFCELGEFRESYFDRAAAGGDEPVPSDAVLATFPEVSK
jgi:hypothetical protein